MFKINKILVLLLLSLSPILADKLFLDVVEGISVESNSVNIKTKVQDKTIKRTRKVNLNLSALPQYSLSKSTKRKRVETVSHNITLNLFDDVQYDVEIDKVETTKVGLLTTTWSGKIVGIENSSVILALTDDIIYGIIATGDTNKFEIIYDGHRQLIQELNTNIDLIKCKTNNLRNKSKIIKNKSSIIKEKVSKVQTDHIVDVMILYTKSSKNSAGGRASIVNMIKSSIRGINNAFILSGVNTRFNLVHVEEAEEREGDLILTASTTQVEVLTKLYSKGDGYLDYVHALRDLKSADLVQLWINTSIGSSGVAYMMESNSIVDQMNAFGVVDWRIAVSGYTAMHEFGHNLGMEHDKINANGHIPLYPYAYGYHSPTKDWRTIMAYSNGCGTESACPRQPFWSNPDKSHQGIETGVEDEVDAARTINQTGPTVAKYRTLQGLYNVDDFRDKVFYWSGYEDYETDGKGLAVIRMRYTLVLYNDKRVRFFGVNLGINHALSASEITDDYRNIRKAVEELPNGHWRTDEDFLYVEQYTSSGGDKEILKIPLKTNLRGKKGIQLGTKMDKDCIVANGCKLEKISPLLKVDTITNNTIIELFTFDSAHDFSRGKGRIQTLTFVGNDIYDDGLLAGTWHDDGQEIQLKFWNSNIGISRKQEIGIGLNGGSMDVYGVVSYIRSTNAYEYHDAVNISSGLSHYRRNTCTGYARCEDVYDYYQIDVKKGYSLQVDLTNFASNNDMYIGLNELPNESKYYSTSEFDANKDKIFTMDINEDTRIYIAVRNKNMGKPQAYGIQATLTKFNAPILKSGLGKAKSEYGINVNNYYAFYVKKGDHINVSLNQVSGNTDLIVHEYECYEFDNTTQTKECNFIARENGYVYININALSYTGSKNYSYVITATRNTDTDNDGIYNSVDRDDDNDGISDVLEIKHGLDPLNASDAQADFDKDGFSNIIEIAMGTNIRNASSKPIWVPIMMGDIITFVPAKP